MTTSVNGTNAGLSVGVSGGVARVTLDRPETRNALSLATLLRLDAALRAIGDDREARVVVLAAEGPVFSSGHDLNELAGVDEAGARALFETCSRVMQGLRRLPQPVIARVQGPAVAAGCQLVAACDLAVVAEGATFATPGVRIGLFCATPMVPLVRAVPAKAALEMLLTGRAISAARALEIGLVNRVVPADRLDEAVGEWVEAILSYSPLTIRLGKAAFYEGLPLDEPAAYERATATMLDNLGRRDAQEGIDAFLHKRRPEWTGER